MVNSNSCTASFTQRAGIAALDRPAGRRRHHDRRVPPPPRRLLCRPQHDPRLPLRHPGRRLLRFPQYQGTGLDSKVLADALLDEAGVACLTAGFGEFGDGYLRFSYANSLENLMEAVDRIRDWTAKQA